MPATIKVTSTTSGVLAMTPANYNRTMKGGMLDMGHHHKRAHIPGHLTRRAYRKYPGAYHPRKGEPGSGRRWNGSYAWSKTRRHISDGKRAIGENKPLVWSGDSRRRILAAWAFTVVKKRSGLYRTTIKLNAPTLNRVRPNSRSRINAFNEMNARNRAEDSVLGVVWADSTEKSFRKLGRTLKRTRRF